MSVSAAGHAAALLRAALLRSETVRLIAATGASQMLFLEQLAREASVDWSRIELFHLDEYVGLGSDHPASFARYIRERVIEPLGITRYHLLDGTRDPAEVIAEANAAIRTARPDIAFVGIGENGHLAFNDPPADFETDQPYLKVELDRACRQQQVNEGWFPMLDAVPRHAISMSVHQILQSREIICLVPGPQKASAVRSALEGPICPEVPASALQKHAHVSMFLDADAASQLTRPESLKSSTRSGPVSNR